MREDKIVISVTRHFPHQFTSVLPYIKLAVFEAAIPCRQLTIWECKAKQHSLMTKYIYFDQHNSMQTLELGLKQDVSSLAMSSLELHGGFQTTSSSVQSSSSLFHCISVQH